MTEWDMAYMRLKVQPEPVALTTDDDGNVMWFVKAHQDMRLFAAPPAVPAPARPEEFACPLCFDQGAVPLTDLALGITGGGK